MTIDSDDDLSGTLDVSQLASHDLLQLLHDPFLLLNPSSGDVELANDAFSGSELSSTTLTNRSIIDLVTKFSSVGEWDQFVGSLRNGDSKRDETRFLSETGPAVPVEAHWGLVSLDRGELVSVTFRVIRSRQETREALRKSEKRLELMADHIQETFWMFNHDFSELLFVNDEYERMFGAPVEELYQNPMSYLEQMHPEDRPKVKDQMQKIMSGDKIDFECRVNPDRNFETVVRIHGTPIKDEAGGVKRVTGTVIDITERKRILEDLRDSEERFRQLAENIDAVFWMDDVTEGNEQLYVSPKYEEIWERSREEFKKDSFAFIETVVEEDEPKVREALEEMKTDGYDIEYRIETPDGQVKWIHDRAFPIQKRNGDVYRIAGIAQDITELKETQQDLQAALEKKEMLLREVHHRVKNNLQVISSMLRLQFPEDQYPDMVAELDETLDRIQSMAITHEILYQSDHLNSLPFDTYAERLVDQVLRSYGGDVTVDCNIDVESIEVDLDTAIPCGLILTELLTNSIKHGLTAAGEGRLTITFRKDEEFARLVVSDTGTGFPEDFKPWETETLGYQLIDTLVKTNLQGSYEIGNDSSGAKVEIRFPIAG